MNRIIGMIGVVLAMVVSLSAITAASADQLKTTVTPLNFVEEVFMADKPVVMLYCPVNAWCDADEAAVAAQVPNYRELKFVKGYFDTTTEPWLRIYIPGQGFIFQLHPLDASKLTGAFWKQRSDFATKEAAAYKAAQAADKAQPFSPDNAPKAWRALTDLEEEDQATEPQWR